MAVDPKELLFRHGEKLAFGGSLLVFLVFVGWSAFPDSRIGDLDKRERSARDTIESLKRKGSEDAKAVPRTAPPIEAETARRWLPVPHHALDSRWAFYNVPNITIRVEAPPQEHVILPPTALKATPSQSKVDLSWTAPPESIDDPGESDPEKRKKTVAQVWGYAVYRWSGDDQKAGKKGRSPATLHRVMTGGGTPGGVVSFADEGPEARLEPNMTYYYVVTTLSDNTSAGGGQTFPPQDGTELQESKGATSEVSVQIPDNVEIKLLTVLDFGQVQKPSIEVRKNIAGTWWIYKDSFSVGNTVGLEGVYAFEDGDPQKKSPTKLDMRTKYKLIEVAFDSVPRMQTRIQTKFRFTEGGAAGEDWAFDDADLKTRHPGIDPGSIQRVKSMTTDGWEQQSVEVPMKNAATGEPMMDKKWKIRVENVDAKEGQKKEFWFVQGE
ncbi:MAG: hypothetical protein HY720_04130 [Planctomycetes bacterium]|nr:hypothetical protein [Planctomycetota bacterium]